MLSTIAIAFLVAAAAAGIAARIAMERDPEMRSHLGRHHVAD